MVNLALSKAISGHYYLSAGHELKFFPNEESNQS